MAGLHFLPLGKLWGHSLRVFFAAVSGL